MHGERPSNYIRGARWQGEGGGGVSACRGWGGVLACTWWQGEGGGVLARAPQIYMVRTPTIFTQKSLLTSAVY